MENKKEKEPLCEYDKWAPEYEPDYMADDDMLVRWKEAIGKLNYVQRKIFLHYVELGSYAACARAFGVSNPTIKKYIEEIKEKLYNNL